MLCAKSLLYASISIFPSVIYAKGYFPAELKSIVHSPSDLGVIAIAYSQDLNVLSPIFTLVLNLIFVGLFAPALHIWSYGTSSPKIFLPLIPGDE